MLAVFRRDLRSYLVTMTGWVFVAFVLLFMGIYSMLYNLNGGYGNFEYVLSELTIVYLVGVPVLTMRSFAEERHAHTDQLLYALPLTSAQIVMGKYLAMLVVLAAPAVAALAYPLVLSLFGEVYLPTAYLCVVAFFLLGAALAAIGMLASSLCESQVTAAVTCFAILLVNYFLPTLSGYLPTNAVSTLLMATAAVAILVAVLTILTKNGIFSIAVGAVCELALIVVWVVNSEALEGLVPNLLDAISLFDRFSNFMNGIIDLGSICCYVAVIVVFCVLATHVFESRRWS